MTWTLVACACGDGGWWLIPSRGRPQHLAGMTKQMALEILKRRNET